MWDFLNLRLFQFFSRSIFITTFTLYPTLLSAMWDCPSSRWPPGRQGEEYPLPEICFYPQFIHFHTFRQMFCKRFSSFKRFVHSLHFNLRTPPLTFIAVFCKERRLGLSRGPSLSPSSFSSFCAIGIKSPFFTWIKFIHSTKIMFPFKERCLFLPKSKHFFPNRRWGMNYCRFSNRWRGMNSW